MKKVLLLLLVTVIWQILSAQKKLYTEPFGVQAYTFRNHWANGVETVLDFIQKQGITELEGGAPGGMTPEEFRKMCEQRGIKIPSTGAGYEQLVKDPAGVAKTAKALGATYVMCAWIPHERGKFNIDNAKKAVEDFNRAGKVLKENGITFCYHNHGYEYHPYGKGTLFDYIVQNTNPEYVSFEMDVLWTIHGGADPVKLLKKYKNRWKLMHVKDLKNGIVGDMTGGTPHENDVIVGTGQADFPKIFKAAKKVGVKHYFLEDESEKEMEHLPKSIAYMKGL